MLSPEEKKDLKSFLERLEVVDEDDKNMIIESFANDEELDTINEALSREDLKLVDAIVSRFDKLIKGGLLISFVALRQQIKALQKELADHRKKVDKEIKDQVEFRNGVNKTLKRILDQVDPSARQERGPTPQRPVLNKRK